MKWMITPVHAFCDDTCMQTLSPVKVIVISVSIMATSNTMSQIYLNNDLIVLEFIYKDKTGLLMQDLICIVVAMASVMASKTDV